MGSISWSTPNTARDEFAQHIDTIAAGRPILHRSIQSTGTARTDVAGWSLVGYAAIQSPDGEVWAYIGLAGKAQGQFYVKDMEEAMGPVWYANVPARLLKLLTPTEHTYAREWREKAAQWRIDAARARDRAQELVGQTVRLETPLRYGEPVGSINTVEVVSPKLWRDPVSGYRIQPPGPLWAIGNITVTTPGI